MVLGFEWRPMIILFRIRIPCSVAIKLLNGLDWKCPFVRGTKSGLGVLDYWGASIRGAVWRSRRLWTSIESFRSGLI